MATPETRLLHTPVLLKEILNSLESMDPAPSFAWDATFGRGGHTSAFLARFSDLRIYATDRDLSALEYGHTHFSELEKEGRITFTHGSSQVLAQQRIHGISEQQKFDFILLDLGVSSPQLDLPERGFSYYKSGPLDMRMDQTQPLTAAEILNTWSEEDLTDLFKIKGEIRNPSRVVQGILNYREEKKPFETTLEFADLVVNLMGWRQKGHHPATSYFLALRLFVNQELEVAKESLEPLILNLRPGGQLLVITFHSTEDRVVKWTLRDMKHLGQPTKKAIQPERAEILENPRARSAKLRIFERGFISAPFLSLLIVFSVLMVFAFLKMEVTRMGYIVLKSSRELKQTQARLKELKISDSRLYQPERIEKFASQKLDLKRALPGQIILIPEGRVEITH